MRRTAPGPKHEYVFVAWAIPIAARISGATDRLDIARDAAETVLSSPLLLGQQVNPYSVLVVRLGLALIAIHEGDEVAARQQYVALEAQRGILVVFAMMAVDRVLGLLCVTIGQVDRAVAHFEDAVTFCRKAGYWPELAWSCCDYADALLRRNNPGDYPKANLLLEEALAISRDLGMRPLMERVIARQAQTLAQEPAPIYLDGLTQREVEVLRLVGFGKSNRQIGEELFISLNTVERHVSNILTKTGTANRADATRYAIRNGLVS
jgi:DNA-binding CsgD family transcriptional regulator